MIGAVGIRVHSCRSCAACVPPAATSSASPATRERATRADGSAVEPGREKRAVTGVKEAPESRGDKLAQSPEEQAQVAALRARDSEVRAHERAHQMAAGGLAGGATFTYQRGPDGQLYAVGGEVPITIAPGRTPEETLQRARTVRSAALAPADPSGPDRAVAAAAANMEALAQREIGARSTEPAGRDRRTEAYDVMARPEAKGRTLDVVA